MFGVLFILSVASACEYHPAPGGSPGECTGTCTDASGNFAWCYRNSHGDGCDCRGNDALFQLPEKSSGSNASTSSLSYATWQPYTATLPLTKVACSDGANGLITRWHYSDLSAMFPNVAAISGLSWNSPQCGKCFKLSDAASKNSINVTIIDAVPAQPGYDMHFNIAQPAFHSLFGDAGIQAGHGELTFEEVDANFCKGNKGATTGSSSAEIQI
eukprot:gnl/MRDRNA2_/MRDRNA2_60324_c0_seq1.p1 gnl/MRDRNA2_/MRDRNA2_60324_c0~~gnl/MRDRNA2_/MRDRNA2_60324_c0_seq1.p1  ORF type:complete len:248 (-),score=38.90 gnl/MRDRNA2_/MRDRNA2_60324_c0_seq1:352-993(-)